MNQNKTLQELTFKDNFMFGAVLLDPENCKGLLERTLSTQIERVEVDREKSIVYNPKYKGVRLDAYAKDANNTRYNVEMQVLQKPALQKRARYYHSQIDMEILLAGVSYTKLPNTYVIFICDFDPFGEEKYRYTKKSICKEVPELEMDDGAHTIFLSTKGSNVNEVSEELVKFLQYVGAPPSESEKDYKDVFVRRLQTSVREVKESREMGAKYMTFQELLDDERAAGREEGREEGRKEGREEGISLGEWKKIKSQVAKKLERGDSVEKIADDLAEDIFVIQKAIDELKLNIPT